MLKLLNLDPDNYSEKAYALLGEYVEIDNYNAKDSLVDIIENYDILLLRFARKIDRTILNKAKNLKVIACNATGVDHIDVKSAEEKGVEVLCLKGELEFLEGIHATAELTWALLLSLVRKVPKACTDVVNGHWNRDAFLSHELHGKSIGILGYGRIGKKIAGYAQAFGMKVFAYDTENKNYAPYVNKADSLEGLLRQSEVLTIHVPYNEETHHLLKKDEFSLLPQGAFVLNTARGAIIDEGALLSCLEKASLGGAAVDVLTDENDTGFLMKNPLHNYAKSHDNLIITPHIGGVTLESWEKTEIFIAKKIIQSLSAIKYTGSESIKA